MLPSEYELVQKSIISRGIKRTVGHSIGPCINKLYLATNWFFIRIPEIELAFLTFTFVFVLFCCEMVAKLCDLCNPKEVQENRLFLEHE